MTPDVPTARGAQSSNSSISVAEPLASTACCTCMPEGKVQGGVWGEEWSPKEWGEAGGCVGGGVESQGMGGGRESTVCTARAYT